MSYTFFAAFLIAILCIPDLSARVEKFSVGERSVTLQIPEQAAAGKPWLWVGEFGGHLKSLETGLVEKGWHVVYVDVSNQFGSPASMLIWEKVYEELNGKRGLSAKPALLGISRGGFYVNAWVRLHPDRASVLYLDNAACDILSWPGGYQLTQKGGGSINDWKAYKDVFGYADDESARAKSIRPTDGMLPAIKAGIYLISCHGTADSTVPYMDNAATLVKLWQDNGGRLKLFPKEGGNHHPHGLPDPKPLIELLVMEAK